MWDPPRPGIEPVSLALAGGFLSIISPGKSPVHICLGYARILSSYGTGDNKRVGGEILGVFLRMVLGKVTASDEAIAGILRDGSLASSGKIKLEINNIKISGKFPNIWKINYALLKQFIGHT